MRVCVCHMCVCVCVHCVSRSELADSSAKLQLQLEHSISEMKARVTDLERDLTAARAEVCSARGGGVEAGVFISCAKLLRQIIVTFAKCGGTQCWVPSLFSELCGYFFSDISLPGCARRVCVSRHMCVCACVCVVCVCVCVT